MEITKSFTEDYKKQLAQMCFYANIYNIDSLGGDYKISNLIKQYNIHPIMNFMKLYFLKIVKISKIDNCISENGQLDLIIRSWISNNVEKDIREFAIILQNGITGEYGPTYNRIGIDSLGFWTKSYLETTKPKIMQRIQNIAAKKETNKTLELASPTSNPVSCPAYISQATDQLVKQYNVDLSPKKSQLDKRRDKLRKYLGVREYKSQYPVRKIYASLEDYCQENGIDTNDFISRFEEKAFTEFSFESDIKPAQFLQMKKNDFLNSINNNNNETI